MIANRRFLPYLERVKRPAPKPPAYRFRGDRMRELRGKETQTEFAVRCGLKAAAVVSDLETEKVGLSAELLWRICNATGCSADWLLGLSDEQKRR